MQTHIKVVAILHIVFGALGIFTGLAVLLFFGGIAGLVGMTDSSPDSAIAIPILGGIGGIVFTIAIIVSLPGLIAGIGLLNYRPWARILTIAIGVVELFQVPFGTALGIYALWALLSREGTALFDREAQVQTYMK